MAEEKEEENKESPEQEDEEEIQGIVRIVGRDLDGSIPLQSGLTNLKGIAPSMARAIVITAEMDPTRKIGSMSDEEMDELEEVLKNPIDNGIPEWMVNRRKDYKSGENLHLLGGDIEMTRREDIGREKDIESRRGIRHRRGLPVRGQRTKSTGRKGMTVGVEREKLKEKQAEGDEGEEEE